MVGGRDLEYKFSSKFFSNVYFFTSEARGLVLNFRNRVHEDPEESKNVSPS